MTASDVINAVREQNGQVAAGRLGQPPVPQEQSVQFQLPINTAGRLATEEQFENIVVKTGADGGVVHFKRCRPRDESAMPRGESSSSGVELGAKNYDVNSYLDGEPAVTLAVFQLPGSNALETAEAIRAKMEELKAISRGASSTASTTTRRCSSRNRSPASIHTLIEAFVLVFIVVLVFLQNWRATIIPMVAVPVSLIGTFAVMAVAGLLAQQPVAVRPGAGDRHRGGRRDRRGRERRALDGRGTVAARGQPQGDGRSHRAGHRHRPGAVCRVRADRVHGRHQRPVLQAVRPDDRRLDGHLGVQLADAQPGAVRRCCSSRTGTASMATCSRKRCRELGIAIIGGLVAYVFLLAPIGAAGGHRSRRTRA